MQSLYLIRVWKESKILFIGILIFIFFQSFFIIKRVQNFPFFIFDMYSRPIEKPVTFTIYEITKNGKSFDYTALTNTKENVVLNSIRTYENAKKSYPNAPNEAVIEYRLKNKIFAKNYQFIKDGLTNDKATIDAFGNWINRYLIKSNVDFSIYKNTYDFQNKTKTDSVLIFSKNAI